MALLEGDIDHPLVVGALYNGRGEGGVPATPDGQASGQDLSAYANASDDTDSAQANLAGGRAPAWHGMGSSGETLTLTSGQSNNIAIGGSLRVHSGQAIGILAAAVEGQTQDTALSLVTGGGELDLQAQNNEIKIHSRDQLKLISANAEVDLAAGKAVHLATSGGASLTIADGNIVIACPGEIRVHAGKKSFSGPAQLSREMNSWPVTRFDERFKVVLHDGTPAADCDYLITRADGAVIRGRTDASGTIPMQKGIDLERVSIEIVEPEQGAPGGGAA